MVTIQFEAGRLGGWGRNRPGGCRLGRVLEPERHHLPSRGRRRLPPGSVPPAAPTSRKLGLNPLQAHHTGTRASLSASSTQALLLKILQSQWFWVYLASNTHDTRREAFMNAESENFSSPSAQDLAGSTEKAVPGGALAGTATEAEGGRQGFQPAQGWKHDLGR